MARWPRMLKNTITKFGNDQKRPVKNDQNTINKFGHDWRTLTAP